MTAVRGRGDVVLGQKGLENITPVPTLLSNHKRVKRNCAAVYEQRERELRNELARLEGRATDGDEATAGTTCSRCNPCPPDLPPDICPIMI